MLDNRHPPFIIALDISKTRTGVAEGCVGDAPRFRSIVGADMENAAASLKLGAWLIDRFKLDRPDFVFMEAALQVIPSKWDAERERIVSAGNPQTTIALAKMVGVVEFICAGKSIALRNAHVQTVRKAFLGQGRPDDPKLHVRAMCSALGWSPSNDDEGDAAAVWWWAGLQVAPQRAQLISPMLQSKVASEMEERGLAARAKRRGR